MRIGLTGPIGAGKSHVAEVMRSLGAGVVEGDAMGRLALECDPALRRALAERFGGEVLSPDGSIDRTELGRRAFADRAGQADLTRLTFPTLYRLAKEALARLEKLHPAALFDAALIYEWGVEGDFDAIIAVVAPRSLLIDRACQRLHITPAQAAQRLDAQLPPEEKARRADYVIDNRFGLKELAQESRRIWRCLGLPQADISAEDALHRGEF